MPQSRRAQTLIQQIRARYMLITRDKEMDDSLPKFENLTQSRR